jgi:hypothetical protein
MILKEYRETYYFYTGKASDISRQLAFAAIAVIWLFKKDTGGTQLTIPVDLVLPGIFVVSALAVDLLQYCLGAIIWYLFYRSKEKKNVSETENIDHSEWLDRPINFLFWAKVVLVALAYYYILLFLLRVFGMIS